MLVVNIVLAGNYPKTLARQLLDLVETTVLREMGMFAVAVNGSAVFTPSSLLIVNL